MPKELVFLGRRKIGFREYQDRPIKDNEIKVETLYSGISHGTEMNIYRGTAPQFHKSVRDGLFQEGESSYKYPMGYGYEEVGKVVEVGENVEKFRVGDIVASAYGHRETAILDVNRTVYLNLVPKEMNPEHAIFQALASVAYDALLTSNVRLGESAVIFGQGVVGLLLVQFCKLAGVNPIIAVDLLEKRLSLSEKLGASYVLNPETCDVAREVRKILNGGSDVVFETSGSTRALHEAIRCGARGYSKVIAVAWYQGPAKNLYLGEEFHHGLGATQIISGGPGINNRLPPAVGRQWDILRVVKTSFDLLKKGKICVEGLITHRFRFEEAEKAYELIDKHPEDCIKVILTFEN